MSSPAASPLPASASCPRCGRAVPPTAPLGACPHCLLDAGFITQTAASSDTPPPTPADLAPEFPQLEIIELLGRGGMGAVYKARQHDLGRLVALKILRPGLDAAPGFAERFTREARALAGLNHPGIVTLYEFGRTRAGRYFILMEFIDGVNLRGLLAAGRLAPREALAIVPPLCDALQYAHDHGLVHRDIKPENILVDRLGRVKIADFGIARLAAGDGTSSSPGTETEVAGTPAYMAPEQKDHPGTIDHRADLYALGVVLYQMLTGELPSPDQLQPPSRRVHIDVRLDEIVLRALEKDPALRYTNASELKTKIELVGAPLSQLQPQPDPLSTDAPATTFPDNPFHRIWRVPVILILVCTALATFLAFSLPATYRSTAIIGAIPNQGISTRPPEEVMLTDAFLSQLTGPNLTLQRLRKNLHVGPTVESRHPYTPISFISADRLEAAAVANQAARSYTRSRPDEMRIIDQAVPAYEHLPPYKPNRHAIIVLGFLGGAILGTLHAWRRIIATLRAPHPPAKLRATAFGALLLPLLMVDSLLIWIVFGCLANHLDLANTATRHSALGRILIQYGTAIAWLTSLTLCTVIDVILVRSTWRVLEGLWKRPKTRSNHSGLNNKLVPPAAP